MLGEAVGALQTLMTSRTLSYCRNPLLICVLVLEQLKRAAAIVSCSEVAKYEKRIKQWEQVAKAIDLKLVKKHLKDIVLLYLDTDIRGRSLSSLIQNLQQGDAILMLAGLGVFLDYGWEGPYRNDLHPMNYSTLYRILSGKADLKRQSLSSKVFCFSFKSWVMRPAYRICITLIATILYAVKMQCVFLDELDRIRAYKTSIEQGEPNTGLPPNPDILPFTIYSICGPLYYFLLFLHCRMHRIPFSFFNPQLLACTASAIGAIKFEYVVYSDQYWVTSGSLWEVGNWTTVWMVGLWLTVIFRKL
jgi:hypothetical protein